MKRIKKTLLVCVLIMLLGTVLSATFTANAYSDVKTYNKQSQSNFPVSEDVGVIGMRISVNAAVEGFAFAMPTYGVNGKSAATLSVYKWNRIYSDTVSAAPLKTKRFTNLTDCATNWFTFDSAIPAGEYFFCIEDVYNRVGTWTFDDGCSVSKGYMYQNGLEKKLSMDLTLRVSSMPGTLFNQCTSVSAYHGNTPSYGQITADQTDLSKYNLPSDSLYLQNDVIPDIWAFTDSLGRVGYTSNDVGGVKDNKTLAMFFWTWHNTFANEGEPFNVQAFLDDLTAKGVNLSNVINNYNYSGWPTTNTRYFWDEPIYGYYSTDDAWVLRKQAELLANAGVDAIFADNTNGQYIWNDGYVPLYEEWIDAMKDGVESPKVAYMVPFRVTPDATAQLETLYVDIYREGKYQPLWYWLDGKPMIMSWKENLNTADGLEKEISEFFTFRASEPDYIYTVTHFPYPEHWGWLSMYPQTAFYGSTADYNAGRVEQVTVGTAQNHDYVAKKITAMNGTNVTGRTYTTNGYDTSANAILKGANFAQQFNYALSLDPEVIFVTGWNEWSAMRQQEWQGVTNAFADQFDAENSRDIEPSRGVLGDVYYYQLVNFVRQFKGVTPVPTPTTATTMNVNGSYKQWEGVQPYFAAYIGNTEDRDCNGYGSKYYVDYSGRNDIIGSQIARDAHDIYILVECADDITPYTDPLWMNIYLDVKANNNGWESFDFVINKRTPKNGNIAYLEKFTGNGYNTTLVGEVEYSVQGRYLQVKIPKSYLGLDGYSFTINYSITDNVHDVSDQATKGNTGYVYTRFTGNILDFYTSGDVAPGGRFKFSYVSTDANAGFVTNQYSGATESWRANIAFDAEIYRNKNTDLQNMTDAQLYNHWITSGIKEGRSSSVVLDLKYYVENNADLKAAFGTNYEAAYNHFINSGYKEKRAYSLVFDGEYYCENNPDVFRAKGDDYIRHYLENGIYEGRRGSPTFDVHYYLELRPDVANMWPGNYSAATRHFASYGEGEVVRDDEDFKEPVVSDVTISNLSKDGFTVTCKVVDNRTISKVSFAVWTLANDQDDIDTDWGNNCLGTKNGDYYSYRVNASAHNNETGAYAVHIYAWDGNGNLGFNAIDVTVPDTDVTEEITLKASSSYAESGKFLKNVSSGTNVNTLLGNFTNAGLKVFDKNGSAISGTTVIGTGARVVLYSGNTIVDEITVVILGDVDGNAIIDSTDYISVKGLFLGNISLSEAEVLAADADKNGVIDSSDYLYIKSLFYGTK